MIPDQTTLIREVYSLHCDMRGSLHCDEELEKLDAKIHRFIKEFGKFYPDRSAILLKKYQALNIAGLMEQDKKLSCDHNGSLIIKKIRKFEGVIIKSLSQIMPSADIAKRIDQLDRFSFCCMRILEEKADLADLQKISNEGPIDIDACRACFNNGTYFSVLSLIDYNCEKGNLWSRVPNSKAMEFLLKNGATITQTQSDKISKILGYSLSLSYKILELISSRGFDTKDYTPLLRVAVEHKDLDLIEFSILHGANVNDRRVISSAKQNSLEPILEKAFEHRNKIIQELVRDKMAQLPALKKISVDVLGVVASYIDKLPSKDLLKKQPTITKS